MHYSKQLGNSIMRWTRFESLRMQFSQLALMGSRIHCEILQKKLFKYSCCELKSNLKCSIFNVNDRVVSKSRFLSFPLTVHAVSVFATTDF